MAADRTKGGFLAADIQEKARLLESTPPQQVPQSLVSKLIPIVDRVRQIASNLGVSPYRVYLVHIGWTGTDRGQGQPRVLSRVEIKPTPAVSAMDSVSNILTTAGLDEQGGIRLSKISPRYTEDDLEGRRMLEMADPELPRTNQSNREFYYEIQENRPSDPPPPIRRFRPASVPMLSRSGLQWSIALVKVNYDPGRHGELDREINAN